MKLVRAWTLLATLLLSSTMLALVTIDGVANAGGVTDATIELPSGKVFYRDSGGKGVPIVLLHASSGNSLLWEYQMPAFAAAGYRAIAIDYRGLNGRGSISTLIDELSNKLNLDKFHLLGTAAGGGMALQYALSHAEKLRSLIVADSVGVVQDKDYVDLGSRLRPSPSFYQLPLDFRELGPSYRAANPEGVKHWLALIGNETPPSSGAGGVGGSGTTRGSGVTPVTWAKLETFKVPTLLMTGDADLYTPPSVLRMFSVHMKQAETAIIPESGHSSYWENPDIFNRTVLAFISKY
jgi:pimeloyl-ACP methyl ester carboxylesterase